MEIFEKGVIEIMKIKEDKMDTAPVIKTKDAFWQMIRGICIIFVVLIHCKSGIGYQEASTGSWNFDYWIVMRQFINVPVGIFVFLAGYFVNIEKVGKSGISYITKRGGRLLVPFLIWSSFYTLISVFAAGGNDHMKDSIFKLIFGLSAIQLYFILVLLQLAVLTPLLIKSIQGNRGTMVLFLITPLYLIVLYGYAMIYDSQFVFYQTFFPAWFIFYYAGLRLKINGYRPLFKRNQLFNSILCCFIALVLGIIEGYGLLMFGFPGDFATIQIKVSSILYVFALINLLLVIKPYMEKTEVKWLRYLGDNSYGIFYIHMFWIMVSYFILSFVPFIGEILPVYQLIQLGFVMILSCISIFIIRKILNKELYCQVLGL